MGHKLLDYIKRIRNNDCFWHVSCTVFVILIVTYTYFNAEITFKDMNIYLYFSISTVLLLSVLISALTVTSQVKINLEDKKIDIYRSDKEKEENNENKEEIKEKIDKKIKEEENSIYYIREKTLFNFLFISFINIVLSLIIILSAPFLITHTVLGSVSVYLSGILSLLSIYVFWDGIRNILGSDKEISQ